jgi:hypothetical protein
MFGEWGVGSREWGEKAMSCSMKIMIEIIV